jgi:hypothetical protein
VQHCIFLILSVLLLSSVDVSGQHTYYIAATGSDSNTSTQAQNKSTPWLHAPGMTNCVSACASYTPVAGDRFIFRGGDTWHYSAGSPIGRPWVWKWSGSSGNPIYIGVDQTWHSGSSWVRPILTMDNPLSSVLLSSCTYDDTSNHFMQIAAVAYVTLDNFEWTGLCQNGSVYQGWLQDAGTHLLIEHNYFHGWSATATSTDVHHIVQGLTGSVTTYNEIAYNVFDGSDSFHGTTTASTQCFKAARTPCQSGCAIYGDAYNVHHNVFRYLSNGIVGTNLYTIHDNLFEYMWISYDHYSHPNVVESYGALVGQPLYFYNNTIHHTYMDVTVWLQFDQAAYEFNNVFSDVASITPGNCLLHSPLSGFSSAVAYIYNNTMDDCLVDFAGVHGVGGSMPAWNGTANFENNHFIGYRGSSLSNVYLCAKGSTCIINDNGSEIFQSERAAKSQGYTASNDYSTTSASGATVGAGANLTSSCSTFSSDSALCSGTSHGVIEGSGNVVVYPAITIIARPSSRAWDAGADLFTGTKPDPPKGLTATPQ